MINIVLIEDEPAALRRLSRLVKSLRPNWNIVGTADSVESGLKLLNTLSADLVLSDIELSDGTCFELFAQLVTKPPIIFITAYDEFALRAFDFHSIHYLLKPIKLEELNTALERFERQSNDFHVHKRLFDDNGGLMSQKLVVHRGSETRVIVLSEVAAFFTKYKITHVLLFDGHICTCEYSLDQLEAYYDSSTFYRINRQWIVTKNLAKRYKPYGKGRVQIIPTLSIDDELIVSKGKTAGFKLWVSS